MVTAIALSNICCLISHPCLGQSVPDADRSVSVPETSTRETLLTQSTARATTMPSKLADLFDSRDIALGETQEMPTLRQQREMPSRQIDNRRIDSIKERITLLKNLMNQGDVASNTENESNESFPSLRSQTDSQADSQADSLSKEPRSNAMASEPSPIFKPTEILVNPPSTSAQLTPILSKPISSLELGNSLFMIGRYDAAFRSYSQLLDTKQAKDHWPRLATGCCQRQLMYFVDAELIFRELANELQADGYLRDYATWNLDYIKHRQTSSEEFKQIAAEIDSIKKDTNNE